MKDIGKIDKLLLIATIIYSIFGLFMIYSASSASSILRYKVTSSYFFVHQLVALVGAYILGFFILLIPTKRYKRIIYLATISVIVLLFYVLTKGKITNNAQSWISIMGFSLQPSEFAKSILIVFMAMFYDSLENINAKHLQSYLIPAGIAIMMFVLIALQPDYGSALILAAIAMGIFFTIPYVKKNKDKVLKICGVGLIFVLLILVFKGSSIFSEERLSRFNFLNPCTRYREDTGYQVCNGYIAISNGGLFGVGLGNSTQKYLYLPESHTDFIFPIICEELGALVGVAIIIGYAFILFRIYKIAKSADNLRGSIIAYGTFWYLALHILVNLLGVLALMPLTGVPLPLLSYGGSFTLNAIAMIFFTERVAIENKKNKLKRQISQL